jgi:hypothetical protein
MQVVVGDVDRTELEDFAAQLRLVFPRQAGA